MAFSTYETSADSGSPFELYEFVQGLKRWNYTSLPDKLTRLGQVYEPTAATREKVKQTVNVFKDGTSINFPRDSEFALQFLGSIPDLVTSITILRGHYGDPDGEFITYFKGKVAGAKANGNTITLDLESVFTSVRRPALRARFEYICRHSLYSQPCGVNREAYKHEGTISSSVIASQNKTVVSVTGASLRPNGYYTGGLFIASDGTARFVVGHTGDFLTLNRAVPGLNGGDPVTIYPGCDHSTATCQSKFNNLDNNGGFPYIPSLNPFGGTSVY